MLISLLLLLLSVTLDGVFGVVYTAILTCYMLARLHNRGRDVEYSIANNLRFLRVIKYFALVTCYCSILWKLNIFVETYKGVVFLVNGYITKYTFLFVALFITQLALLMLAVYAEDLLNIISSTPHHIHVLREKEKKNSIRNNILIKFVADNYFGIILLGTLAWSTFYPSLFMIIPLIAILIATVRKQHVNNTSLY